MPNFNFASSLGIRNKKRKNPTKKSLCAENAEANSERNLYNPPSGLVLSLHVL
jgi:hypothetical protein